MKKVSVVMGYYNRKKLLIKTLESIQAFTRHENFEVVIVDDGSIEDERLEDIVNSYSFDIILYRISPSEKSHINPCVAYNKAFSLATGEVIVIQNPECFHYGDVISYASTIKEGQYFSYHCYSLDKAATEEMMSFDFKEDKYYPFSIEQRAMTFDGDAGYYVHKDFRPDAMHFCTAIAVEDLEKLGGFDNRFSQGYAYDDREFYDRILRLGLDIVHVDSPMVFHQNHYDESSKNHLSLPNNSH